MTASDVPQTDPDLGISVIVPSYNPGVYFREALLSALEQMGPHDEILVQDADSQDGSQELLAELTAGDPRIKSVVEADNGQSDALNRALRRARNPWILWLNADDLLLPSALATFRAEIRADPTLELIVGAHQIVRADGSCVDDFAGRLLNTQTIVARGCAAFSGSILMRTAFLVRLGGFERDLNTVMDLSLQLRMAAARPRQVLVPTAIGALRFHEASKSANLWSQFVREGHLVRMRHARGVKQHLAGWTMTLVNLAEMPLFRLRLTPGYRTWRRRALRVVGG